MDNQREIIFYFEKDKKISVSTNKTNGEIAEILQNYNYFINIDNEEGVSCINLKQVIFIEMKEKSE